MELVSMLPRTIVRVCPIFELGADPHAKEVSQPFRLGEPKAAEVTTKEKSICTMP